MTLFKDQYRIESARFKDWDYRRTGTYFITICTKNKQKIFGRIVNDKMILNDIGKIVNQEWLRRIKFRNYAELDEYIIMPNHVHGIILLHNDKLEKKIFYDELRIEARDKYFNPDSEKNIFERKGITDKRIHMNAKSISSIIAQFKSNSTKKIRSNCFKDFNWQTRFYDHIIRTEKGLKNIREYIHNNPIKWNLDEYY